MLKQTWCLQDIVEYIVDTGSFRASHFGPYIVTCLSVTIDGVSDLILDLLSTYTPDLELQVITASALVSTLYKSPRHPLSFSSLLCLDQPFPGNGFNSGDLQLPCSSPLWMAAPFQLSLFFTDCHMELTWLVRVISQSYFTTDGLQPISSSWRQAPWESQPAIFPPNWTLTVIVLM
jgi:hypothetical protein